MILFVVLQLILFSAIKADDINSVLTNILEDGVNKLTYPGAVGIVGTVDGKVLYKGAVGHHTYDTSTPLMNADSTWFDLASVSKVLGTTSAVALLYQRGYLNLDMKIADVLDKDFAVNNKDSITIKHCLLHEAGFQPDPNPQFWDEAFGCPEIYQDPVEEKFTCLNKMYDSIMNQELISEPGTSFLYSDISFMTLQLVVGKTVYENELNINDDLREECISAIKKSHSKSKSLNYVCYFESFLRTQVFTSKELPNSSDNNDNNALVYRLSEDLWKEAAPTIDDTILQKQRVQGKVSDGNCYIAGGICGHAGLFGTANIVSNLMSYFISAPPPPPSQQKQQQQMINAKTMDLFSTVHNASFSSRALGWDTNSYVNVSDQGFDHSCGSFPASTFMHIGYTGTCVCGNTDVGLYTIILTNRVYNCEGLSCTNSSSSTATKDVYRQFNSAAFEAFSSQVKI